MMFIWLLIGYSIGKCQEWRIASSNEICLISIEERKIIVKKLIHSARYSLCLCRK